MSPKSIVAASTNLSIVSKPLQVDGLKRLSSDGVGIEEKQQLRNGLSSDKCLRTAPLENSSPGPVVFLGPSRRCQTCGDIEREISLLVKWTIFLKKCPPTSAQKET